MPIDTASKRRAAFVDEDGILIPDGSISSTDRANELGQYYAASTGGASGDDPDPTWRFGATVRDYPYYGAEAV